MICGVRVVNGLIKVDGDTCYMTPALASVW